MKTHYENIVNASRDFITLVSKDYVYEFANDAYCLEIGKTREQILGKSVAELWGKDRFEKRLKKNFDEALAGREAHDIDRFIFGEGYKYIHVSYYPYWEDREITHVMIYSHDISIVKGLESRLIDYEFKDPTTGLFNRKSFDIVFDMELEKARRSDGTEMRVLLFANLRNFSEINLQYGHEIGDLIMESTGLRMKENLRAADYVFRFEGREFCAILTSLKRITDVALVATKLWEGIVAPYPNKQGLINPECNMGLTVFPDDGTTKDELIKKALSAVNEAKATNEHFVIFNRDLHDKSLWKMRIKANIRKALVEDQFSLRFQPVVYPDGTLAGAETLIRWNHPELGWIGPSTFIPIAEEAGDILMVGRWVFFQLCALVKSWEHILKGRYLSVNLSSREFESPELVEELLEIIEASNVQDHSSIKLEITETRSMKDIDGSIEKIQHFRNQGLDIFIDDFGSGYSSLAYLKKIPCDVIKIDKSFVDGIGKDPEDLAFLRSMISLVESKKKQVIIEGVGLPEQYVLLKDQVGVKMQGFYFAQPLEAHQLERLLVENIPLPHPDFASGET